MVSLHVYMLSWYCETV